METRHIRIAVTGKTGGDLELAFDEAVARIRNGNVRGTDRNDAGSFSFDVMDETGAYAAYNVIENEDAKEG